MRRFYLGKFAFALSLAAVSLLALGCPSKNEQSSGDKGGGEKGGGTTKTKGQGITPKEFGTIKGKITWKGEKPNLQKLTDALVTQIKGKDDRDHCLAAPEDERTEQEYRIGANNGLGNVIVWVQPENRRDWFVVPKDQLAKVKGQKVTIHQPYCAFVPHCMVLFPTYKDEKGKEHPTGQVLEAVNDTDKAKGGKKGGISHNTKIQGGSLNPEKGHTLEPGQKDDFKVAPEDREIVISCNIHPWMRAYARALYHPWAAVSKAADKADAEDYGTFKIEGVPVGMKVRVFAWHERLEYLTPKEGKVMTLKDGETVNFDAQQK